MSKFLISDELLNDFILSQRSVHEILLFDLLETHIHQLIHGIKQNCINAQIVNLVLALDGQLQAFQIYLERENGFSPTTSSQYGTNPTAYRIQIRSVFGMHLHFGKHTFYIPPGEFERPLKPFLQTAEVHHDLEMDVNPAQLILGPGVKKEIKDDLIKIYIEDGSDYLFIPDSQLMGMGYQQVSLNSFKYQHLLDFEMRYKLHGLYPLFYASANPEQNLGLLRFYANYPGHTFTSDRAYHPEPRDDSSPQRRQSYVDKLRAINEVILSSPAGQRFSRLQREAPTQAYVLSLRQINGNFFYDHSNLPVIRLRDYQTKLYIRCIDFIRGCMSQSSLAATINMGVGAGKTFFTYTLLKRLQHAIQHEKLALAPPYCMVPNAAIAEVTAKSINQQGLRSASYGFPVHHPKHLVNQAFVDIYHKLSQAALIPSQSICDLLSHGVQDELRAFCLKLNLHPLKIINLTYNKCLRDINDSIDPKRIFLLIEGQKTLKNMTQMLSIDAIFNFQEQLSIIKKGLAEKSQNRGYFTHQASPFNTDLQLTLPYHRVLPYIASANHEHARQQEAELSYFLQRKYPNKPKTQRDVLQRIAFMTDNQAALLFANSGGLGNTYSDAEIQAQIRHLIPKAVAAIQACLQQMTFIEEQGYSGNLVQHYNMYLYIYELMINVPESVHIKKVVPRFELDWEPLLYQDTIYQCLSLVDYLHQEINQQLEALPKISEVLDAAEFAYLSDYGLRAEENCISALKTLVGYLGLRSYQPAHPDLEQLKLSYIPIFTPEGFASYIEYIDELDGQQQFCLSKKADIYQLESSGQNLTQEMLKGRLNELFTSLMLADEAHKEEFSSLYDPSDAIHQRIDRITLKYFAKNFLAMRPHRLGMSGTLNQISQQAFSRQVIFELTTPDMINQGLLKQVHTETFHTYINPTHTDYYNNMAKEVLYLFYQQNRRLLETEQLSFEAFRFAKTLIFSKLEQPELKSQLALQFQHLKSEESSPEQLDLFMWINEFRHAVRDEVHQGRARNACPDLSSALLVEEQRALLADGICALYLEMMLSKSKSPKEMSDIIGISNRLNEQGIRFSHIDHLESHPISKALIQDLTAINPQTITQTEVQSFLAERACFKTELAEIFLQHKTKWKFAFRDIIALANQIEAPLFTDVRLNFEIGLSPILWAGEAERTGYSHEPVGIVIDTSHHPLSYHALTQLAAKLSHPERLSLDDVNTLFQNLSLELSASYSFDEKNQMGGRALRTPKGQVRYLELHNALSEVILKLDPSSPLYALLLTTRFEDIFTANKEHNHLVRLHTNINRDLITRLNHPLYQDDSRSDVIKTMIVSWREELADPVYFRIISQHFAILWMLKQQDEACLLVLQGLACPELEALTESIESELRLALRPRIEVIENEEEESPRPKPEMPMANWSILRPQINAQLNELDRLIQHPSSRYNQVRQEAKKLKSTLEALFTQPGISIHELQRQALQAIEAATPEFAKHRGIWDQVHPILKAIVGTILVLTGLFIFIAPCLPRSYQDCFFKTPKTKASQELGHLAQAIRQLEPIPPA